MFVPRPASTLTFQRPPIQHEIHERQRGSPRVHSSFGLSRTRTKPRWLCNTIVGTDSCVRHVPCGAGAAPSLERFTSTLARTDEAFLQNTHRSWSTFRRLGVCVDRTIFEGNVWVPGCSRADLRANCRGGLWRRFTLVRMVHPAQARLGVAIIHACAMARVDLLCCRWHSCSRFPIPQREAL